MRLKFPIILETQNCPQVLTLLTLSEARGGGVSVRSLIISTSETYCKFISKMSAWLGFPLEEGHSGKKKIKLRKTGASRALTHPKGAWKTHFSQGLCKRCATSKREESRKNHSSSQQIFAYHVPPAQPHNQKISSFSKPNTTQNWKPQQGFHHLLSKGFTKRLNVVLKLYVYCLS